LTAKPQKNAEEHPPLQGGVEAELVELRDVEGVDAGLRVIGEVEREDAEQHDHAADQGVEEELDRRVEPVGAAPDPDQEVHRDEHHLPEQEEEHEVERHERAEHAALQARGGRCSTPSRAR
jgi:hypothetical protein